MRGRLLHGFGYVSSLRGDYVEALVVAKRAEALAAVSDDPELMLVACFLHGEVHHLQGRTQAARSWMERGLAIAETLDLAANEVFAADPQVTLLGMLAIDLVRCGLVQQGRALVQRAHARAAELRQPMTRLVAIWQEALLEVRLGSADRVAALADEMQALVDEFSLAHGQTACRWFRGWAEARKGRPREGYRLIREAYEQNTRLGMRAGASEVLGYAAEALLLAGDVEGAQAQLEEALQIADELGERVYLPQLLLLEARDRACAGPARGGRGVGAARRRGGAGAASAVAASCSRWWSCARTTTPRPRSAKPSRRWWTGCPKRRAPSRWSARARCCRRRSRPEAGRGGDGQPAASRARCSHSSLERLSTTSVERSARTRARRERIKTAWDRSSTSVSLAVRDSCVRLSAILRAHFQAEASAAAGEHAPCPWRAPRWSSPAGGSRARRPPWWL